MTTLISELEENAASITMRRRKYLVMWSGGLDSTWTLHELLSKSEADVFAHHVAKRSRSDDGEEISSSFDYERTAVRNMLGWMSDNLRPFEFSESFVDLTAFPSFARDMTTSIFMSTQAAMSWGFTPDDRIFMGSNGDEDDTNSTEPSNLYRAESNMMLYRGMMQAVTQADRTPEITWLMPAPTRHTEITDLPDALVEMAACCRHPLADGSGDYLPCGTCVTCKSLGKHLPKYRGNKPQ